MNAKTLLRHELIGLNVEVISSSNKSLVGLSGKVIDETKNCLILENTKKIPKSQVKLKIKIKEKTFEIEGKKIIGRPEKKKKK
jgi:ribonuclease P protein subunit POP4